jgi:hypothetical protein
MRDQALYSLFNDELPATEFEESMNLESLRDAEQFLRDRSILGESSFGGINSEDTLDYEGD